MSSTSHQWVFAMRLSSLAFNVLMTVFFYTCSTHAHAQGLAVVVDVTGGVTFSMPGQGGGQTKPVMLLDYLQENAKLELKPDARLQLVYLQTSKTWQFAGPGEYTLLSALPKVNKGSPAKPATGGAQAGQSLAAIEPSHRERIALGAVVMRSSDSLRLTGPIDEPVLGPSPTLVWEGGGTFRVRVLKADGGVLIAETQTDALQWRVPKPLPPGRYEWRVESSGQTEGTPGKSSFFEVLANSNPKRKLLGGGPPKDGPGTFGDRVVYAARLEHAGLTHEALLQWRKLAAERPDDPALKAWAR